VSLDCSNQPIQDLAPLSQLTNLHILKCEDCQITTLAHLSPLKDLQVLRCGKNSISTLQGLEQMRKLTELDIQDNEIVNLEVLQQLPNLEFLDISNNKVRQTQYIQYLGRLKTLSLKGNDVIDIRTFGACTALQRLDISHNQIVEISALGALDQLMELNISHNQVKNLQDLYQLPNLEHIDCRANPLARDEAVFFKIRKKNVSFVTDENTDPNGQTIWTRKMVWLFAGVSIVGVFAWSVLQKKTEAISVDISTTPNPTPIQQTTSRPSEEKLIPLPKNAHKWWKSLSPEWRELIAHNIARAESDYETTPDAFLREVYALTSFDCKENKFKSFAPLGELTKLQIIDCQNTGCTDYSFLKKLPELIQLACSNNKLTSSSIAAIAACTTLKDLDCSDTGISNLAIIKGSTSSITYLNCSNNQLKNLRELANANQLQRVDCENNQIQTLKPLYAHKDLFLVNCSGNPIAATELWLNGDYGLCFVSNTVDVDFTVKEAAPVELVITKADHDWWKGLSKEWKQVLEESTNDTYEEDSLNFLVELFGLEKLDLNGKVLLNGNPLRKLKKLTYLDCSNTGFSDFSFLKDLKELEHLDCSNNPIKAATLANIGACIMLNSLYCSDTGLKSLSFLTLQNQRLEFLDCSHNQISSLEPLYTFPLLAEINCSANPPLTKAPWWKNKDYENYFVNKTQGRRIELILE
jgi:Leucine-rich repeat (LRR) protein